jgi:NAD-dependent deacetylase
MSPSSPGGVDAVERANELVQRSERIVVLTGAGISTDSGIADYRGPNGLWTKNPKAERTSDIRYYLNDPEVRRLAWEHRLGSPIWEAEPNAGHLALVELERQGRLDTLVTQNIDGLHHLAGSRNVVELHGTAREVMCIGHPVGGSIDGCGWRAPYSWAFERLEAGDPDPHCPRCGSLVKSATVSFGQMLFPGVVERATELVQSADVLLVAGSSLQVYPAAALPMAAVDAGARLVIVNDEPTPFDGLADLVVRGKAGEVLAALDMLGRLG